MRRYYPKYTDAKRALREAIKEEGTQRGGGSWTIYDLGKHRKVRRYFIGHYIEWLNLDY